jgi:hypothetical protein
MFRRLGIDLSCDAIALADVGQSRAGRVRLHGYGLIESGDPAILADDLRAARRRYRFPRNAEVVAWSGDPRLEAVRDAGFDIERVIEPGDALRRVERMRRQGSSSAVTAVIALHATSGALAVIRGDHVVYEAPLTWLVPGAGALGQTELLRRYAFLSALTEVLRASFDAAQRTSDVRIGEILACGSLPELRSIGMAIAEEFNVEVETLDSLEGLDVRLTGAALESLRQSVAALWVAIAAGRRWHAHPRSPARRIARFAIPAALAGAAVYALAVTGSFGGAARPTTATEPRRPAIVRPTPAAQRPVAPVAPAIQEQSAAEARVADSASPASQAASPAPGTTASAVPADADRAPMPIEPPTSVRAETAAPGGAAATARPATPSEPAAPRTAAGSRTPERMLSASLAIASILWAPERQFAVIDGRVVGVGDVVSAMRIVEIQPDGVIARDRAGRLRRAALNPLTNLGPGRRNP